jgi:hypothetical protein
MRIKRYEFERNNYDIIITESIKLSNLVDILIGCDVPRILRDIKMRIVRTICLKRSVINM